MVFRLLRSSLIMRTAGNKLIIATVFLLLFLFDGLLLAGEEKIVVIVNDSGPLTEISEVQIKDIYLGHLQFIKNLRIVPLHYRESGIKEAFLSRFLDTTSKEYRRYWISKSFQDGIIPPPSLDNLRNEVNRLFIIVTGFLVTGDEAARDRFDLTINEITALLAEIRSQEGSERWHETAAHMGKDAPLYAEKALEILYVEHPVGNEKGIGLIKELDLLGQDILKEAEGVYEIARKEVEQKQSNARSLKGFLTAFALSASGILFLSMLVSYLYLRKSIINPLRELHRGAEIIANGGLSHRLNISTGDEIEDLAH